jgi:hypothetical protein
MTAARTTLKGKPAGRRPRGAARSAAAEAVREHIGATLTLRDFRATAGELTAEERELIVEQAIVMLEQVYVHLPLKRAMHAVDPLQRLRLLRLRLPSIESESAFHAEMLSIYNRLRDLHTVYVLPSPYQAMAAALPFRIEEFFENGERKYLVTQVSPLVADKRFKVGVVPTYWNGIPIDRAVEINADRAAGSNPAARHAQGLESMTNRWMGRSLPPDEEWVVIRYEDGGAAREIRFEWQVISPGPPAGGVNLLSGAGPAATELGVNVEAEVQRRVLKLLFAPEAVTVEQEMSRLGTDAEAAAAPAAAAGVDMSTKSILPDVFSHFGSVTTPEGDAFGYIRIRTFSFPPDPFVREFVRLLGLVPQRGLILDVRGNGGGFIAAGERILQTLTPKRIEPALFSFISSPLTDRLCGGLKPLSRWHRSIRESIQTGAAFSQGFPLTPVEECNDIGQKYHGPVVLITDAQCYSTTDMFAAGFQDHGIGKILGTAASTGAGGANVWAHQFLVDNFPDPGSPFLPVPRGASFNVAVRRSTRVGERAGVLLEDLGVAPDDIHKMTNDDVLKGNVDLIRHATRMLKGEGMEAIELSATVADGAGATRAITAATENLDRLDAYINDRPQATLDVADGDNVFQVPVPAGLARLELRGYRQGRLAASTRLTLFPTPAAPTA